jgi:hypothetical protein
LLKAVDSSKSNAKEESRTTQSAATLHTELGLMRSARDSALKEATESKRKASLLADELQLTKNKLSRVSQEKIELERDYRLTKSLAKKPEVDTNSSECDFYKRKAS